MTNELFMQILGSVITVIAGLITAYIIPLLKAKISTEDFNKLLDFISLGVKCANQIFTPDQWKEKKEYVVGLVTNFINKNLSLTLTEQDIDSLIEAYVNSEKNNK